MLAGVSSTTRMRLVGGGRCGLMRGALLSRRAASSSRASASAKAKPPTSSLEAGERLVPSNSARNTSRLASRQSPAAGSKSVKVPDHLLHDRLRLLRVERRGAGGGAGDAGAGRQARRAARPTKSARPVRNSLQERLSAPSGGAFARDRLLQRGRGLLHGRGAEAAGHALHGVGQPLGHGRVAALPAPRRSRRPASAPAARRTGAAASGRASGCPPTRRRPSCGVEARRPRGRSPTRPAAAALAPARRLGRRRAAVAPPAGL